MWPQSTQGKRTVRNRMALASVPWGNKLYIKISLCKETKYLICIKIVRTRNKKQRVILRYFISFHFILFYFVLLCFILFYFTLPILSHTHLLLLLAYFSPLVHARRSNQSQWSKSIFARKNFFCYLRLRKICCESCSFINIIMPCVYVLRSYKGIPEYFLLSQCTNTERIFSLRCSLFAPSLPCFTRDLTWLHK